MSEEGEQTSDSNVEWKQDGEDEWVPYGGEPIADAVWEGGWFNLSGAYAWDSESEEENCFHNCV